MERSSLPEDFIFGEPYLRPILVAEVLLENVTASELLTRGKRGGRRRSGVG
jgi:hypothetical protein